MMANMGDKLENLRYVTIYTLMPGQDILAGTGNVALCCITMVLIWLIFLCGGRPDLHKKGFISITGSIKESFPTLEALFSLFSNRFFRKELVN